MDTRETVDELLRRVAAGAPEKIAELYADDVDWMLDWPDDDYSQTVPWIRYRATRAGVADHFRLIAEHHVRDESSATVGAVLVDGTDAVVLGEFHNTAKPTGRRYVAAFALHLTVEHGLITRHHVYEDSLAVARAFATDDRSARVWSRPPLYGREGAEVTRHFDAGAHPLVRQRGGGVEVVDRTGQ